MIRENGFLVLYMGRKKILSRVGTYELGQVLWRLTAGVIYILFGYWY